ncbi:MAG: exonuclease SbcCD subunit D [Myxococcota bacterium]
MSSAILQNPVDRGVHLLAIGDVHLGIRPGSLPDDLSASGTDARGLGPAAALEGAVDAAIARGVDAVLFAGDVVESTNARFEALLPLEAAVGRLVGAGIRVIAVAGNHDVEALPRLAQRLEGFELLGAGGRWESTTVGRAGGASVEILGWSFPERQVRSSPVARLLAEPIPRAGAGIPRIGLLHADLDASGGSYAPVARRDLDASGVDAWLLGHIHAPSLGTHGDLCGYLGSLVGLDPSETGVHGPWSIRADAGGVHAEQLPIAPLRWERIEADVRAIEHAEDLGELILDAAEQRAREIRREGAAARALGVRIRLVGATRIYDDVRRWIEGESGREIQRLVEQTLVFVDRLTDGTELAVDLSVIAAGEDPPALLARKLLLLEGDGDESRAFLDGARAELRETVGDTSWLPLADARGAVDPLSDDALRAVLKQAGTTALHALLDQREATS